MYYLIVAVVLIIALGLRIVTQYEKGVVFRFGRIVRVKDPGLNVIIPFIEQIRKVDLRTVTMPVPTQKIITKDNVSVEGDLISTKTNSWLYPRECG